MKRIVACAALLCLLSAGLFAAAQGEETAAGELEPVTISFNLYNSSLDYDKDSVYQWVKDEFNVDFKHYQASGSDWQEKIQIWVASGDMPDVINWDFKYHHMPQYNEWVRLGALRAMPEDLSPYPNLTGNLLDKMVTDDLLMIDGKRYALPKTRSYYYHPGEDMEYIWQGGHIMYRRDWAKEVGLYKENDIYTWDEFVELAKAFIEQDPGNNGEGKTIGYVMQSWAFSQGFTGLLYKNPDYMGYAPGYYLKDGEYVWAGNQPEMVEGIKAFKELVDEGILWSDQPVAKGAAGLDRYFAGEAGFNMNYNASGSVRNARQKMIDLHGMTVDEVREATALMHIEMDNGSLFALPLDDYWSISVFSAKMSDVKMDRWLQLQDWLCVTENYLNARYGWQGEGWDYGEDGSFNLLWDYDEETQKYITPDNVVNNWYQFWTANNEAIYSIAAQADMAAKQVKAFEDIETFQAQYKGRLDGYTPADPFPKFFSGENFNKYGNFAGEVHEKIVEIVYSDIEMDEIDDAWAAFVDSKMPQVQAVLDELNAAK